MSGTSKEKATFTFPLWFLFLLLFPLSLCGENLARSVCGRGNVSRITPMECLLLEGLEGLPVFRNAATPEPLPLT